MLRRPLPNPPPHAGEGTDVYSRSRRSLRCFTATCLSLLCATLLSACGSLLQSKVEEPQVYRLQPSTAPTAAVAYSAELAVSMPTATPGLDTARIAVLRAGNQLDYFYGARWGGTTPQVVQSFLVALLQSQQAYKSAVAENSRVDPDYVLDVEVRDFQAEYRSEDSAPIAHISLMATLINIKSRAAVAQLRSSATVTATDNRLGAVVAAFQSALQQASVNLSEQLTASLEKH
jgi:cholesterol transport system auxiliary component